MKNQILKAGFCFALITTLLLAFSFPVMADKPSWAGNKGNSHNKSKKEKGNKKAHVKKNEVSLTTTYFNREQRNVISNYYSEEYHRGHCPPGLAKKKNGCMPPGQAKKWRKGQPLSDDVVYYDLPSTVVRQLGRPPEGHRYIRVARDILLITTGTRMIVDAIQDLDNL